MPVRGSQHLAALIYRGRAPSREAFGLGGFRTARGAAGYEAGGDDEMLWSFAALDPLDQQAGGLQAEDLRPPHPLLRHLAAISPSRTARR